MEWNKFVAGGLALSVVLGIGGVVFAYDVNFSNALYTLAGTGLYVFGIWAAFLLVNKK